MGKSRFRLQKVLEIRETIEKERQKELSLSKGRLKREEEHLESVRSQKNAFARRMNQVARARVRNLVEQHNYLATLSQAVSEKRVDVSQVRQEVEHRRKNLLQASKERKVLEKLKERREEELAAQLARSEQAFFDELAANRRNAKANGRS